MTLFALLTSYIYCLIPYGMHDLNGLNDFLRTEKSFKTLKPLKPLKTLKTLKTLIPLKTLKTLISLIGSGTNKESAKDRARKDALCREPAAW